MNLGVMLARQRRGREWRLMLLVAVGVALAGCGGDIKNLLKDTPPAQENMEWR